MTGIVIAFGSPSILANGRYLIAATKFHQPNSESLLTSPFILATRDTCILFFYQLRGGVLSVKIRHQSDAYQLLWSRSRRSSSGWEMGYQRLPTGYYRIVMEAKAGTSTDGLNVAIDDLSIGPCIKETGLCIALCIYHFNSQYDFFYTPTPFFNRPTTKICFKHVWRT